MTTLKLRACAFTLLLLAATPAMAESIEQAQRRLEILQQQQFQQMQQQQLQFQIPPRPTTTCTQQCTPSVYGRQCTTTCN